MIKDLDTKSSPEARGSRVRRLRNMANLSRQAMCQNGEIKLDTLIGWELGRHGGLTVKGAVKLINFLAQAGISSTVEWLLYEVGNGPVISPNFAVIQESLHKKTVTVKEQEKHIIAELLLFRKNNPDAVELLVPDNCMAPYYHSGDYVAGVKYYQDKLASLVGLDCIVQPLEGDVKLRRIIKGDLPDQYTLIPHAFSGDATSFILLNTPLAYAAPVIWHRKKNVLIR